MRTFSVCLCVLTFEPKLGVWGFGYKHSHLGMWIEHRKG